LAQQRLAISQGGEVTTIDIPTDIVYDPHDRATLFDPHPLVRRMRDEAPLYYSEELDFYALTRFEDVGRTFVDRARFISGRGASMEILRLGLEIPPGTVAFEDPPTHTIHRALLSRMFTPKRVSALEPEIRQMCAELLDPMVGSGGFDLIEVVGRQVPMRVISRLLGIPESDQESIRDAFGASLEDDHIDEARMSGAMFADYIDWRAEHPSDDIMTQLMYTEFVDETGTTRRLERRELLAYVNLVAGAGNETTDRVIGWMGKLLSDNPDQRRALVEDRSLVPNAVEETLRLETPLLQSCRYVNEDVELYGHVVPEGSIMAMVIAGANRDERRIPDPDRFDVHREASPHFSLGFGPHYCLGQALARLEARLVLEAMLERFPDWEVVESGLDFNGGGVAELRGWNSVPLVIP
jgi:cytochrome P450